MEKQKEQLGETLRQAGWQITKIDSEKWWVREMWQLQSGETNAFATFLVDPANMELVWAVLATKEKPLDYAGEPPRYVLPFKRFDSDIHELTGFLTQFRNVST